jgi:hypothetical protein
VDKSGKVKVYQKGKLKDDLDMTKENKFRWFIEDITHIQIGSVGNDSDFFKALKSIRSSAITDTTGKAAIRGMFDLAARVLLYQHANANSNSENVG